MLGKTEGGRQLPQPDKEHLQNYAADITVNNKFLNSFFQDWGKDECVLFH